MATKDKYPVSPELDAELTTRFTYHAPAGDQPDRYRFLRTAVYELAQLICALCPESRERSLALTKLEEVSMWSNASIARREEPQS